MTELQIYDLIGYIATALIVISMIFKTTSFKGTLIMRIINLLGSIAFAIYGFGANALPTGIANVILAVINIIFIIIEYKDYKKCQQKEEQ